MASRNGELKVLGLNPERILMGVNSRCYYKKDNNILEEAMRRKRVSDDRIDALLF